MSIAQKRFVLLGSGVYCKSKTLMVLHTMCDVCYPCGESIREKREQAK